ncbi:PEP-CTERM sorting domain-containing protein [Agarivorans aestuarii]|uniref:PEP-CTERM sorting domain-containing protein n=1 Tax=Agarivorans aestuarii TaxID=1563703 RepID=A0ABU7G2T0_9ALTE|nr:MULTISPECIES: PEP-CTERM sorting domain-containing protein [Agarivorans]MEE1673686.1 PEP-CTERM sorting domain-containing protein [Agarivorans aestuarii]
MKLFPSLCCALVLTATVNTVHAVPFYLDLGGTNTAKADFFTTNIHATSALHNGNCTGGLCSPDENSSFTESGNGSATGLYRNPNTPLYNAGLNSSWAMTFDYSDLSGGFTNTGGVSFDQGGNIDINFATVLGYDQDSGEIIYGDSIKVAQLVVNSGSAVMGDVSLSGSLDYSWYDAAVDDALTEGFFTTDYGSLFELWENGDNLVWQLNFNITNNMNTPYIGDENEAIRDTILNGQLAIVSVSEPGTLALFGIGLIALGLRRQHKKL